MKQKIHSKHGRKKGLLFFLTFLILYVSALTIPYVSHKKVPDSFKKTFHPKDCYSDTPGTERVAYITDNTDALLYRLKLMEEAQHEIILSTFDFNADSAGLDVMAALLHAADRGVQVKVIVDGVSGFLDVNGSPFFKALVTHENVQLKIYNPIHLLKPWKVQARLHDKYLICDRSMYMLGGRNTTNLFLGDYSSHKNIDKELFVYETEENSNSSLLQLVDYFESVWALPDSRDFTCPRVTDRVRESYQVLEEHYFELKERYPDAWKEWDWKQRTISSDKITLLSNPIEAENKAPHMWYCLDQLILSGEKAVICTPYIICGKEMYADLAEACQKISEVEIITNDVSSGANPWGCTDYLNQKKHIWATGVQVYEYLGPHSNHTKAILVDDGMSIIGSYNLDMRSTYQDTELMLAVDSPELNRQIQEQIAVDKTYSRTMREDGNYEYGENYNAREMSIWKKCFYFLLRVLTVPIRRFL